jgi:hypothetical protein
VKNSLDRKETSKHVRDQDKESEAIGLQIIEEQLSIYRQESLWHNLIAQ